MPETANSLVREAETLTENASKALKELVEMDFMRNPVLREGQHVNLGRMGNREAVVAQSRGEIAGEACKHCDDGFGPFVVCVQVEGHLKGACANCHYNSGGYRCSFRPGKLLFKLFNLTNDVSTRC